MPDEPHVLSALVVATQLSAPLPGGTGRYAANVLRSLDATRPAGAGLTAYLCGGVVPGSGLELPVGLDSSRSPMGFRVLARLWERGLPPRAPRADLVHATTLMVPPTRAGSRLVVTVHDVVPWTHPETLTPRGVAFHRRMAERVAGSADLIIAPTAVVARRLDELLQPACPVRVVPPAVAAVSVPADAPARRRALGVPPRYLLVVGTAEPRKGLDVLVDALAADPGLPTLVVVGPQGWGDVGVDDLARRRGVGKRVLVVGRVSDPDLAALYAGALTLVVPSRAEGFGLPVIEAMSVGVPVVTSDDPALVEVGGGVATIAPVGDAEALAAAVAHVIDMVDMVDTAHVGSGADRGVGMAERRRAEAFAPALVGARLWAEYAAVVVS